jgi:hypothetical protein
MPHKFLIVTLIDKDIDYINKLTCRELFYRYKTYNDLFDVIDIRKYDAKSDNYDLTILDRYASFVYLNGIGSYQMFIDKFNGTNNLVMLADDIHSWVILPHVHHDFPGQRLSHTHNKYDLIQDMFKAININDLITFHESHELNYMKNNFHINTYVLNCPIDPTIYKDYGLEKIYDVICYGTVYAPVYPLRNRVHNILIKSGLKILHVNACHYDPDRCDSGLAQKINQSWLGVATLSVFDLLVHKYFEIAACNTVIVGNMNEQGKKIWENNYIDVNESMTDAEILAVFVNALADKKKLSSMAQNMYKIMHSQHTIRDHKNKLYGMCTAIASRK